MTYQKEILTSLYKVLDYMTCEGVEGREVIIKQITELEEIIKEASK